jgi:phage gpG-like protein
MTIEVNGLDEALVDLEALAARMSDMTPATRAIATEVQRFADHCFATRTGPDGARWAPLKGPSRDKGVMRSGVYAVGTANSVHYGGSIEWTQYHQNGTPTLTARPFLPTSDFTSGPAADLWLRIEKIIARYIALASPTADGPDDENGFGDFRF